MKKAVAMKWVKALRSGKYKKGRMLLKEGDRYCCLGVLCEISEQDRFIPTQTQNHETYLDYATILPPTVMGWAGMQSDVGECSKLPKVKDGRSLVNINDHKAKSFRMIANLIEKHWKDL